MPDPSNAPPDRFEQVQNRVVLDHSKSSTVLSQSVERGTDFHTALAFIYLCYSAALSAPRALYVLVDTISLVDD
jgi:hypothetical protein